MKVIGWFFATVVGLYLIGRAVAEPFLIDMSDPSTYHLDWGGPSLFGVLLVHCGPGVLALVGLLAAIRRRRPARGVGDGRGQDTPAVRN